MNNDEKVERCRHDLLPDQCDICAPRQKTTRDRPKAVRVQDAEIAIMALLDSGAQPETVNEMARLLRMPVTAIMAGVQRIKTNGLDDLYLYDRNAQCWKRATLADEAKRSKKSLALEMFTRQAVEFLHVFVTMAKWAEEIDDMEFALQLYQDRALSVRILAMRSELYISACAQLGISRERALRDLAPMQTKVDAALGLA